MGVKMNKLLAFGLALACLIAGGLAPVLAFAATAASAVAPTLSLPWGAWMIEASQVASAALVPIAGAFLLRLVQRLAQHAGQFAGPLQQILTNALIDRMVKLAVDFALAAIEGAAKGKTVDVKVAPAVIAPREDIDTRFHVVAQRRDDLQKLTDDRVARIERDLDNMQKSIVPRGEHEQTWATQRTRDDGLQRQLDQVRKDLSDLNTPRDTIQGIQRRIEELDRALRPDTRR